MNMNHNPGEFLLFCRNFEILMTQYSHRYPRKILSEQKRIILLTFEQGCLKLHRSLHVFPRPLLDGLRRQRWIAVVDVDLGVIADEGKGHFEHELREPIFEKIDHCPHFVDFHIGAELDVLLVLLPFVEEVEDTSDHVGKELASAVRSFLKDCCGYFYPFPELIY